VDVVAADVNRDGFINAADVSQWPSYIAALPEGQLSGPIDNQVGWDGYVFNPETRQYLVRFRCYSPVLGRWLERDRAEYVDAIIPSRSPSSREDVLESLRFLASVLVTGLHVAAGIAASVWAVPPFRKSRTRAMFIRVAHSSGRTVDTWIPYHRGRGLFGRVTYGQAQEWPHSGAISALDAAEGTSGWRIVDATKRVRTRSDARLRRAGEQPL
jgi:RHS repeat-associated protein